MEFVLIIIVVVIVSVISAAMKKKPQSSGEQNAPPRPTMTDIQRAFMMAAGIPDEEQNQPPVRAPYGQQPGPYAPPYQPPAAPYAQTASPYAAPVAPYAQTEAVAYAEPYASESYKDATNAAGTRPAAYGSVNPFSEVQIGSYFMDDADDNPRLEAAPVRRQIGTDTGIPLFEDQRDIVKALIYAEILPRRSSMQRNR